MSAMNREKAKGIAGIARRRRAQFRNLIIANLAAPTTPLLPTLFIDPIAQMIFEFFYG
jgi:hypothetical protein